VKIKISWNVTSCSLVVTKSNVSEVPADSIHVTEDVKGKVSPLQARCGPEGGGRGIVLLFHDRGTRRG